MWALSEDVKNKINTVIGSKLRPVSQSSNPSIKGTKPYKFGLSPSPFSYLAKRPAVKERIHTLVGASEPDSWRETEPLCTCEVREEHIWYPSDPQGTGSFSAAPFWQ